MLDLLNNNYRVTIIDNFDNAFDECWARMQRLAGDKAEKMKLIRVRNLWAQRAQPCAMAAQARLGRDIP